MAFNWDEQFGSEYFITVTNEERRYLGLDPIQDDWEITQYTGKTNITYSRTTVFWNDAEIRKVIVEEIRLPEGENIPVSRSISEHDTFLKTDNRKTLLPLTAKGKPKPVTASNILAITPFGSTFELSVDNRHSNAAVHMYIYNARNCRVIPIGEKERVARILNDEEFHRFMEYYMSSCPADYFDRVSLLRTAKHKTVKYKTGDVFRIELDRFNYCYGMITGRIKDMRKWTELPERHSFRHLMMVPIMIRYFELTTTRSDMTVAELAQYPLSRMAICGDNDIIWGRHSIIGHKELTGNDIEFNLVCTRTKHVDSHSTMHTYDGLSSDGIIPWEERYNLYVEWGTASVILPFEQISDRLRLFLKDYKDMHGGVHIGIFPDFEAVNIYSRMDLLNPNNAPMKAELFICLGLNPDAEFDDFAKAFNGLTKAEILKRLR